MVNYSVQFPGGTVRYLFDKPFSSISDEIEPGNSIIITDSHIAPLYKDAFAPFKAVITLPAGESHKTFTSLLNITQQLLHHQAHKKTFILGVGGGMVTDIAGFAATVYMRGVPFALVPTSLLGMVDAAVGGKNGVNVGLQKNLLGAITQPDFILFDTDFLSTLQAAEWSNGFAEVIKYACLFDTEMFRELSGQKIIHYLSDTHSCSELISKCVEWKNKIVLADERETGLRKLLNFGHTSGHAFETVCRIPHGHAVALGMLVACTLSEQFGLDPKYTQQLKTLLQQYQLPVCIKADVTALMDVLTMDKKRNGNQIDYIILKDIAQPEIIPVDFATLQNAIQQFMDASHH